jgi:uncharacterized Ntn-hydrolase superfamily protein
MANGLSAPKAVQEVTRRGAHIEYRQVLAIDAEGHTAIHSGAQVLGNWNEARGKDVASGGNLLAHDGVPAAIVSAFEASAGHLGDRLLTALEAGLAVGGEAGPVHSAGLMLVDKVTWPVADLRCDWIEDCPLKALRTAWEIYKPQLGDYVSRALDPSAAPSYGVPGDT